MKNVMNFFIVVFLCVSVALLSSCSKESKDGSVSSKGSIKFSIGMGQSLKSVSVSDTFGQIDSTAGYSALVTIVDQNGQVIYNAKKLTIYKFGEQYVSESLTLKDGSYKLTEFMVSYGTEVVYASPVTGSEKAQLVNYPLPLNFTINTYGSTLVSPEVLSAQNVKPVQFGYASFNFSVIETMSFKILAIGNSYGDSASGLQASLYIRSYSYPVDSIRDTANYVNRFFSYNLPQGVKTVDVIVADTYLLTVRKPGYNDWTGTYSLSQLRNYNYTPLKVYLLPLIYSDSTVLRPDSVLKVR